VDARHPNGARHAMSRAAVVPASLRHVGRFWRIWRARLGAEGVVGGLLLVVAAAAVAYAPFLRDDAKTLHADVEALRTSLQSANRTRVPSDRGQAETLRTLLPPLESGTRDLRTVFAAASRHHVALPKGEYTLHRAEDGSELARLDVVIPIKDRYATIKALIADLLNELPHASLGELKMERSTASADLLDARVRLTLHYRER
jgi:hypothetical protein